MEHTLLYGPILLERRAFRNAWSVASASRETLDPSLSPLLATLRRDLRPLPFLRSWTSENSLESSLELVDIADGGGLKVGGADCWRTSALRLMLPRPLRNGRWLASTASFTDDWVASANNGVASTATESISATDAKLLVLDTGVIPVGPVAAYILA